MQIQKFGIEIRKLGDVSNLYRDVDMVLSKYRIPSGSTGLAVQVQAVAHALQKMVQVDSHFSICTIDNCIKVGQVHISKERYDVYRSIHCLNWNEMLPDFRNAIIAMVLDDFRSILNPEVNQ